MRLDTSPGITPRKEFAGIIEEERILEEEIAGLGLDEKASAREELRKKQLQTKLKEIEKSVSKKNPGKMFWGGIGCCWGK